MSRFLAIVLAAGRATRFGSDKLAAPLGSEPLLAHAVRAACAAPVKRVIVMAAARLDLTALDLGEQAALPLVEVLRIDSLALSDTLKAGIVAAHNYEGAFIFLGDMPRIPHGIVDRLADALGDAYAAMPRYLGKPGHPVLLSAAAFPDIADLSGDQGAGPLLRSHDDVVFVDCAEPGIHLDIDRPEDLATLQPRD